MTTPALQSAVAALIFFLTSIVHMSGNAAQEDSWHLPERYVERMGFRVDIPPSPDFLSASNGVIVFIHVGISKKPVEPLVVTALSPDAALLRKALTGIEQSPSVVAFVSDHVMTVLLTEMAHHSAEYKDRLISDAFGTFIVIGIDEKYGWARFLYPRQVSALLDLICENGSGGDAKCEKISQLSAALALKE